VRPLY